MRHVLRLTAAALAVVALAPPASAAEVTALSIAGGSEHSVAEGVITVNGTATGFGPAVAAQTFTDAQQDGDNLAEATPAYQDLVAGFIGEDLNNLYITWQVVDFPEPPVVLPFLPTYYYEFNLNGTPFQVNATFDARGRGTGTLGSNCTTTANVITCDQVPNSQVAVAADPVQNTITAGLRRRDLKDSNGRSLAVDGARLEEVRLFRGIAAFTSLIAITSSITSDEADMERAYFLGRHVEIAIGSPGLADEDVRLLFGGQAAVPRGDGSFTAPVDISAYPTGDYAVYAQACSGGNCGAPAATPLRLT